MNHPPRPAPRGMARGLVGLGQLPAFTLASSGGSVSTSQYRGRRHLVIWLAGSEPDVDALVTAAGYEEAIRNEGAELLVVLRGAVECADALRVRAGLQGPVLADPDGAVHARLGADPAALLVVGRNGTVYWRAEVGEEGPDFAEALSWLAYLNILEPECGTCEPAWPVEVFERRGEP